MMETVNILHVIISSKESNVKVAWDTRGHTLSCQHSVLVVCSFTNISSWSEFRPSGRYMLFHIYPGDVLRGQPPDRPLTDSYKYWRYTSNTERSQAAGQSSVFINGGQVSAVTPAWARTLLFGQLLGNNTAFSRCILCYSTSCSSEMLWTNPLKCHMTFSAPTTEAAIERHNNLYSYE